jgi:hypothetical protein
MMGWACGLDGAFHREYWHGNLQETGYWKERQGAGMLMKLASAAMDIRCLLPPKCFAG